MKLSVFSTLDAILRHGTMANAAQALNLTPSAVSMQMKQLEVYFGQPLFDRSGLQVQPTPAAFEVAAVMSQAQAKLDLLRRRPSLAIEGTVRLGVVSSMQPVLVPGTVRRLRACHPGLRVIQTRGKSAQLINAVKAGELDAAVVAQPENGGSVRLDWHALMRREMVLIAPPGEPETSMGRLFERYDWINYDRTTATGQAASRYVFKQLGERRSSMELDGMPAMIAMVSAGLGVAVVHMAEPGITAIYPVKIIPLTNAPSVQFSLVMRRADSEQRLLSALVDALSTVVSERM